VIRAVAVESADGNAGANPENTRRQRVKQVFPNFLSRIYKFFPHFFLLMQLNNHSFGFIQFYCKSRKGQRKKL
jgi:hypothetical protein